jgi:hypothetical protein
MKSIFPLFIVLLLLISMAFTKDDSASQSLPVVELFTSEGCSSCPAADNLLEEMTAIREREGKPFIGLSFHVTYWNRLGWIDSFSNQAFTDRQKKYQALFKSQLYTPQAVVNGRHEFVGSNVVALRDTLTKVENDRAIYTIHAKAIRKGDSVAVEYSLDKDSRIDLVNVALIEKNSERRVKAGENKNKTLKHFNVVREFRTMPLRRENSLTLPVDPKAGDDLEVVVYVQRKNTMKIVSAVKVPVE